MKRFLYETIYNVHYQTTPDDNGHCASFTRQDMADACETRLHSEGATVTRSTSTGVPVHTIYLHRTPTCWIADMRFAPDAAGIKDAMGTCWIPTPFTPEATLARVVEALKPLNPGALYREGNRLTAKQVETL